MSCPDTCICELCVEQARKELDALVTPRMKQARSNLDRRSERTHKAVREASERGLTLSYNFHD